MSVGQIVKLGTILLGMGLFTSACGVLSKKSDKLACEQRDWYELGRHDGAQGFTLEKLANYKKDCATSFNALWETMYSNGRNAGLVEYCAPENSYELGRMGITYHYVCPSTTEPEFLAGYRRGQQAREIEIQNQKLDADIDALIAKMTAAEDQFAKRQIASELDDLRKTREKNERTLDKIQN